MFTMFFPSSSNEIPLLFFKPSRRPKRPKLIQLDVSDLPKPLSVFAGGIPPHCPQEVIELIFKNLDQPSDLLHVISTSRLFCNIGLPVLYRSIEYVGPDDLESNKSFWGLSHMHTRTKAHSMTVTGPTRCAMVDSYYIYKNDSWHHRPNWTLEELITLNRHLLQLTELDLSHLR
ncbi:hypothetical protein K435DRAFT_48814 [Dendrothele bispora CBS 962.96]|uniref:F-box domain-containing protein n=1 Tax=Dendrothele bispora (strain CBS 962.96) TaxID=1314807 RepID=A0A4S8M6M9_DENBC|nr:hypothetical protein K435DRAFT_48814 [Dendrothele bispora CBS 962.96]